jgi:hypothetical protein
MKKLITVIILLITTLPLVIIINIIGIILSPFLQVYKGIKLSYSIYKKHFKKLFQEFNEDTFFQITNKFNRK